MPIKHNRLGLSEGASMFVMAFTLSGSIFMPSDVIVLPMNLSFLCLKLNFFGLNLMCFSAALSINAIINAIASASSNVSPVHAI